MFITRSTFDHNIADGAGAIAVASDSDDPVTLIVADSAFTENRTGGTGASAAIGIFNHGLAVVTNTTFARNSEVGVCCAQRRHHQCRKVDFDQQQRGGQRVQRSGGLWSIDGANTSTILVNTILARKHGGIAEPGLSRPGNVTGA